METKVKTSSYFLTEKKYVLDYFFESFLGWKYILEVDDKEEGFTIIGGKRKVILPSGIFSLAKKYGWLDKKIMPIEIKGKRHIPHLDTDFDILFGENKEVNNSESLSSEIDFFGTAFFFLARVEEFVIGDRDEFGRFPFHSSIFSSLSLRNYPIVNAHFEGLWDLLQKAGFNSTRKKREYNIELTIDLDHIRKYSDLRSYFSFLKYPGRVLEALKSALDIHADPYFKAFKEQLGIASDNGVKPKVFLLFGRKWPDSNKQNSIGDQKKAFDLIYSFGVEPQIHFGFPSDYPKEDYSNEIADFQEVCGIKPKANRFHYLRMENPGSFKALEQKDIASDFTMGFAEMPGFRAGIADPFPIFDLVGNRVLKVMQHPLILMDQTFISPKYLGGKVGNFEILHDVVDSTRLFGGTLSLLWHNSVKAENYEINREFERIILDGRKEG